MRSVLILLSLTIGICPFVEAADGPAWQDLLNRADSLATAGYADSADETLDDALSRALRDYGRSDTTVELAVYESGETRRYYFPSYAYAESLYARALAVKERIVGRQDIGCARLMSRLAELYDQQEKYADAEPLYRQALEIKEKTLGPDHPETGLSVARLAEACEELGRLSEAESLQVRALSVAEKALGADHPDAAFCLSGLGLVYEAQGKYSEAESLFARAAAIREKVLGPEHTDVAESISMQGRVCVYQGELYEAESLSMRALAIREKSLGPEHHDVAYTLSNLVAIYFNQGRYSDAEVLCRRELAIDEKVLGPNHPDVAYSLFVMSLILSGQDKYTDAEATYLRAISIYESVPAPDLLNLAEYLNNLGALYLDQARFNEAEILLRRSLDIRLKTAPSERFRDVDVAVAANNLAALYWNQAKFAEAEPLFNLAIRYAEETYGPNHPRTAYALGNLGALYLDEARYADAERVLKRALDIRMNAPRLDSLSVGSTYNKLGHLYNRKHDYAEAERCYKHALELLEGAVGPDQKYVEIALNGLGLIALSLGKPAEAETLFKRSVGVWEGLWGVDDPDMSAGLANLAIACHSQGRHYEAESYLLKAIDIREKVLGPADPGVAVGLACLARVCRSQGRLSEALANAQRASSIRLEHFIRNAAVLREKDALLYSRLLRTSFYGYLSCYLDSGPGDTATVRAVADRVVSGKAVVSDMALERQRDFFQGADSTTLAAARAMRQARHDLSELFVRGPDGDLEKYRAKVDSLSASASASEDELLRISESYRKLQATRNISATSVASLLPERSALVEYLKYSYMGPEAWDITWTPSYLAIVIVPDQNPAVINLGEASAIDSLVGLYRAHMLRIASAGAAPTVVDQEEYSALVRHLYRMIWQPLEGHLANSDMVFVAPDGALNTLSFAGLRDPSGKYLIERFTLHCLSAGRDLARLAQPAESGRGLLALGDPDYDVYGSYQDQPQVTVQAALARVGHYSTRNVRPGCKALGDLSVGALPGTRKEVKMVASSWKRASREPVSVYFGTDASEERLKAESAGKRVIHLATHGYFVEGDCQPDTLESGPNAIGLGGGRDFVGENPLLLSGLFLAGGNLHGVGADSLLAEDGILTAYEVSAMDLEGAELVVLSACETGLGMVKQGEGVYGLRRAFQMAGARTVVSALWPVSDEATAKMMSKFYGKRSESIPETMRRIQLERIKDLRRHRQPDHPFAWAGFVATGEWR